MLPLAEGPRPFTYPAKGWMRPCQLVFFPNALQVVIFHSIQGNNRCRNAVATASRRLER
jgi:hypothetical protein